MNKEEIQKLLTINDEILMSSKLSDIGKNNPRYREVYKAIVKECINQYNYHALTDIIAQTNIEMNAIFKGFGNKKRTQEGVVDLTKEEIIEKHEATGEYIDGLSSKSRDEVAKLYDERIFDLDRDIMKQAIVAVDTNLPKVGEKCNYDQDNTEYYYLSAARSKFMKHEDEEIRAFFAGHCDIKSLEYMKGDSSDRVKNVIYYRTNFKETWNDKYFFDEKRRERILFLEEALKNGDIEIMDTKVGLYQPEAMRIKVSSQYFEPFLCDFDQDLVKSISDKRILASYLETYMRTDLKMDIDSVIKHAKQDDIKVIGIDDELSATDSLDSVLEQELGYVPNRVTQNMGMANLLNDIKQQKMEETNTLLGDVSLPTKKENESLTDTPKQEPTLAEKVANLEGQVSTLTNELQKQQGIIKQQNEMLKEILLYVKGFQTPKEEIATYDSNEDDNNKSK